MMNKLRHKYLAMALVFALLLGMFPVTAAEADTTESGTTLQNPTTSDDGVTTWDCIYFGNYYQSSSPAKDPIKWRVLSVDGDDVFLLADQNLDCRPYNTTNTSVTWGTCTLRSWLNGYGSSSNQPSVDYSSNNFINAAFTQEEQQAIKTTTVENEDNLTYGTTGGNTTYDKVYLLSISEVMNTAYGFTSSDAASNTRCATNTAYAAEQGASSAKLYGASDRENYWWLRSPGNVGQCASIVRNVGSVYTSGYSVYYGYLAVRPALHLDLSSASGQWKYAGIVDSNGKTADARPTATPTVTPTSSPTEEPTSSPTTPPTVTPTVTPTATPTVEPTATPTVEPTVPPTVTPTAEPTVEPTAEPTVEPTTEPTATPTVTPAPTSTAASLNLSSLRAKYTLVSEEKADQAAIQLSWTKNSAATGYEIYRAGSRNGTYQKLATVSAGETSYTDRAVTKGKTYYYRVQAVRNGSAGSYAAVTGTVSGKLARPTIRTAKYSGKQLTVKFRQAEGNKAQVEIYDGSWSEPITVSLSKSVKWGIGTARKGYKIRVRTYQKIGGKRVYSKWSKAYTMTLSKKDSVVLPQSMSRYLKESELKKLSEKEILLALNELYARRGYLFQKNSFLVNYFNSCKWYKGKYKSQAVVEKKFNKYERRNRDILVAYEKKYKLNRRKK